MRESYAVSSPHATPITAGRISFDIAYFVAVVLVVLLLAYCARRLARCAGQPAVVGEIAFGLLIGPAVVFVGGDELMDRLLPAHVREWLGVLGHAALALFLVEVGRELRAGRDRQQGRAVGWISWLASAPPLAAGALLAGWVVWTGDASLRGDAPGPAFVLLLSVSLAVTAVPVLARILVERDLTGTRLGRLAMSAAVGSDIIAWLLLTIAVGLAAGSTYGVFRFIAALMAALLGCVLLNRVLRTAVSVSFARRFPGLVVVVVATVAVATSALMRGLGVADVIGALLVGLALPAGDGSAPFDAAARNAGRAGRFLVPVFFVVTGVAVFAEPVATLSLGAIVMAVVLGTVGKVGGTYLGARMAGEPPWFAVRLGILMNTRGLTELVVLQAGHAAGILTASMFLALVVMALVTTASTGPLFSLADRLARRAGPTDVVVAPATD